MDSQSSSEDIDKLYDKMRASDFEALTVAEKQYFSLWWFFATVENGGLHQYFFNDAGGLAVIALDGLQAIGASQAANILREAMSVFPDGACPVDQEIRRAQLLALPGEVQWDYFSALGDELYQVMEEAEERLQKYIQGHRDLYPALHGD